MNIVNNDDDGPWVYYKLTSGELKSEQILLMMLKILKPCNFLICVAVTFPTFSYGSVSVSYNLCLLFFYFDLNFQLTIQGYSVSKVSFISSTTITLGTPLDFRFLS